MKGCMNCGNISCGNNKKRESAGCGRWISPEDKIAELQKIVEGYDRNRDRLKAMGFPTFASCKEYCAKLEKLDKAKEIIKNLLILHNDMFGDTDLNWRCMVVAEAEKFPMECPDVE